MDSIEYGPHGVVIHFVKPHPFPPKVLENSLDGFTEGISVNIQDYQISGPSSDPAIELSNQNFQLLYFDQDGVIVLLQEEPNEEETVSVLSDLSNSFREELNVQDEEIEKAQLQAEGRLWRGDDTRQSFEGLYSRIDPEEIFEGPSTPASLRLISYEEATNPKDGHDVRLEPFMQNTDYYYLDVSVTRPNIGELSEAVEGFEDKLLDLVESLEG